MAAESVRGVKTDAERSAGYEAVVVTDEKGKREEASATVPRELVATGPCRAVIGVVTRKVEVVSRLNGPLGRVRTSELKGVVEKLQPLVRQRGHTSWAVSAVVYVEHRTNEILLRVTGVGKDAPDEAIRTALVDDISAVVGGGLLEHSWVEDRLSKYVVVESIPEAEWLRDGASKLKGGEASGYGAGGFQSWSVGSGRRGRNECR